MSRPQQERAENVQVQTKMESDESSDCDKKNEVRTPHVSPPGPTTAGNDRGLRNELKDSSPKPKPKLSMLMALKAHMAAAPSGPKEPVVEVELNEEEMEDYINADNWYTPTPYLPREQPKPVPDAVEKKKNTPSVRDTVEDQVGQTCGNYSRSSSENAYQVKSKASAKEGKGTIYNFNYFLPVESVWHFGIELKSSIRPR